MEQLMRQRDPEEPAASRSAMFSGGGSPLIMRTRAAFDQVDEQIDRQIRQDAPRQQRERRQTSAE